MNGSCRSLKVPILLVLYALKVESISYLISGFLTYRPPKLVTERRGSASILPIHAGDLLQVFLERLDCPPRILQNKTGEFLLCETPAWSNLSINHQFCRVIQATWEITISQATLLPNIVIINWSFFNNDLAP